MSGIPITSQHRLANHRQTMESDLVKHHFLVKECTFQSKLYFYEIKLNPFKTEMDVFQVKLCIL